MVNRFRRVIVTGILLGIALLAGAACSGSPAPPPRTGPLLLQENTLEPTLIVPTRAASSTPSQTPGGVAGERLSALEVVTLQADFVVVTPTLPPSKTPTATPTITRTPTVSPTPTVTVTATATRPLFPTSIVIPVTAPVANPLPQVCDSTWFFIEPRPAACPLSPPVATQGVFQSFENGYMIWSQPQDAIYVMYSDQLQPRWQVFRDQFEEGMQEDDPAFNSAPRPNTWQPRRGFGMLWRSNTAVRDRIGWATDQWETPYSLQTQVAADGTIYLSDPQSGVFGLLPNGTGWQRYAGFGAPLTGSSP